MGVIVLLLLVVLMDTWNTLNIFNLTIIAFILAHPASESAKSVGDDLLSSTNVTDKAEGCELIVFYLGTVGFWMSSSRALIH